MKKTSEDLAFFDGGAYANAASGAPGGHAPQQHYAAQQHHHQGGNASYYQQQQHQPLLGPQQGQHNPLQAAAYDPLEFADEPPLLEELGIHPEHIWTKTTYILLPFKNVERDVLDDDDLSGPLVFCFILGVALLFSARLHFGYIYGYGAIGCALTHLIISLMHPGDDNSVQPHRTVSILGYCLLPLVALAVIRIVVDLRGSFGFLASGLAIVWCTYTATRYIETVSNMRDQRYLIAFPVGLLYTCLALITVF